MVRGSSVITASRCRGPAAVLAASIDVTAAFPTSPWRINRPSGVTTGFMPAALSSDRSPLTWDLAGRSTSARAISLTAPYSPLLVSASDGLTARDRGAIPAALSGTVPASQLIIHVSRHLARQPLFKDRHQPGGRFPVPDLHHQRAFDPPDPNRALLSQTSPKYGRKTLCLDGVRAQ